VGAPQLFPGPVFHFLRNLDYIVRSEGARLLEFALFLTEKQLAIGFEHGGGRNTSLRRHIVVFHHILILVSLADIDVHHDIVFLEQGRNVGPFKGEIQDVAVIAPIRAKDDQNALMLLAGLCQRFFNLGAGVGFLPVNLLVCGGRLLQTGGVSSLTDYQSPILPLLLPELHLGDVERLFRFPGSRLNFRLKGQLL